MRRRREVLVAGLVSVLAAVAMTWPGLAHPASTVPGDLGDPLLEAWTIGWDGHAVLHQLAHPFDANILYPLRDTLGFSDSLFGYLPLGLFGRGTGAALVRYNCAYVFAFALCGFGAYLLARQLGVRAAGAAVAGAAFAYGPWRGSQAGHLQILSCGAVPLSLALLARGHGIRLRSGPEPDPGPGRPGYALLGWLVGAWQLTFGFGVGLQWAYLLVGLTVVVLGCWLAGGRPRLPGRLVGADLVGGGAFALTGALFAVPYLVAVHDHPEARRTVADLRLFSPPARGFLVTPATNWLWGSRQTAARAGLAFPPEMALGLGLVVVVLAVLGALRGRSSARARVLLAGASLVLFVFALGTAGPAGGRFTYLVLFHHAPGFSGIRTPGRLVVTMMVPLSLLAALGAETLVDAVAGTRGRAVAGVAGAVLAGLVLLEGFTSLAHPQPAPAPAAALHTFSGPVFVLPSDDGRDDEAMFWTTDDYEALVNGSSGFDPTETLLLRGQAAGFPHSGVQALRAAGITRVVVLLGEYTADSQQFFLGPLPAGVSRRMVDGDAVYSLGGHAAARHP